MTMLAYTPSPAFTGVLPALMATTYHRHPSLSASLLTHLQSWLPPERFYHYSWLNPLPPRETRTVSKHTGTAGHTLLLEPHKFQYQILEPIKNTQREGFLGGAPGGQLELLLRLQDKLLKHPWAAPRLAELYRGNAVAELSVFTQLRIPPTYGRDDYGPIPARCRFDIWHPDWTIDLKFVRELNRSTFDSMVRNYRYIHRGAWYERIDREVHGAAPKQHWTLFIEKEGANTIWPLQWPRDALRQADGDNVVCLENYVRRMESYGQQQWPGFASGIQVGLGSETDGSSLALATNWDRLCS